MRYLALTLALLAPFSAQGEGAQRGFTCTTDAGRTLHFEIAPMHTDATGKGQIRVTFDGTSYDGVTSGDHGPFQFGDGAQHYALLLEGEAAGGRLKAELHHATAHSSTLTPLTCEADF